MTPTSHRLELVGSFLDPGQYAACSCGWDGPSRPCTEDARQDFERHLLECQQEERAS